MCDSAEELGYVVTDIQASVLRMLTMKITGCDDFHNLTPDIRICADSMMRAAASYGANNGAYKIESHITELNPFFASIGFTIKNNIASCDLKNIIKICKS
ncbi:MAG TPA: hypothetical protein VHO94_05355 [Oscillospiraceae bacterium]|nr:hypothetical protein [Oscillospiraceae bacterium]